VPTLEQRTIRKVSWRLLPLIIVIYFVAYIDRTNVGFAALTMNKDLGLSAYVFGWGAGIFFLGYFLFEVPSNIILEKVGARVWIARIMITRSIVSGAMAFVQGPVSFVVMRFEPEVALRRRKTTTKRSQRREFGQFPHRCVYPGCFHPAH
jgi:MFS transporter, ACS family, tartrate transporter